MDAKYWIEIIDHIFWWILVIGAILWFCGAFDKD